MRNLIVVESTKSWPITVPGAEVVSARDYLVENAYSGIRYANVVNMCRSYSSHTLGYYVSLMAEARRHRPMPSVVTHQDLRQDAILRIAEEEVRDLLSRAMTARPATKTTFDIFFGQTEAKEFQRLGRSLFNLFPAPFLRAELVCDGGWHVDKLRLLSLGEVAPDKHDFVVQQLTRHFARPRTPTPGREFRFDLAILVNPAEVDSPSDAVAIQRFGRAAEKLGISATVIGKEDIGRIAEFDALFIRETTYIDHHTYRFSRRAAAEGLVVIDDPISIARCTNKVFLAEAFARNGVPCPKTVIVHKGNTAEVGAKLGFPCVLKRPDSSFSLGVSKAADAADVQRQLAKLLGDSELVVAQEWVPSEFDWRVGVLGGKAFYVCKYHMARGHWQIQKNLDGGRRRYGKVETLSVEAAPPVLLDVAQRAARLIGNGLYGVDVKEVGNRFLVMEVNDNPSIDSGVEDQVLKDDLYLAVMRHFLQALETRGNEPTRV